MNKPLLTAALFLGLAVSAQQSTPTVSVKSEMEKTSLVKNIPLTNIGPTVMSGRVVDVDVNPENSTEFYVGYASGGLWYTNNNGTSFTPLLDNTSTQNVGDIAVDWKTSTIWVGTGENNSSRSSYAGIGLLKSTDKGKTWTNAGLPDSHHIGRIIINPNNIDEVVVAVAGHLYTTNSERGIYKTTDGGATWKKTLFINDATSIIDVAYAPEDYTVQYAAAWEKDRKAWNFSGSGEGSGLYKSTDAGATWNKISTPESGFPTGDGVGRIGIAVHNKDLVFVVHDNQARRKKANENAKKSDGLEKDDFKTMSKEAFLALDDKKLNSFLKANGFQEKYRAPNVKQLVRSGTVLPEDIAKYLEDANAMLFDTPVIGAEVYKTENGGKQWTKVNEDYIDGLFYSYGYYFAQISVDPTNPDNIYLSGVPLIKSEDGGKTYQPIDKENVHADHHALWIDPKMPKHLINGNDGGINITYDDGATWIKNNSPSVGQFYYINYDFASPYNVYGGLQDNGVWKGAHNAKEDRGWQQSGQYPWKSLMGGDGMQIQVDNRDNNTVYTGFQFGNYFRIDVAADQQKYIQPKHQLGETPYRFNWQTPILLSSHNQDILYLGGNKLHRSLDQGDHWETISNDLTNGGKKGNVAYGTLTTIAESPFAFGLLYTGSDDGKVHYSNNGGGSWTDISKNLPANPSGEDLWVSRIVASAHQKNRVYLTLNGYRNDDFTPYVYKSEDNGASWVAISSNIPDAPVNVILEDPANENLLFVGTDNGLYVSFNQGISWELFKNGMPNVAVHDIKIQPEAKHLLVGTHGRSIFKADISHLQQAKSELLNKNLSVFSIENIRHSSRWGNSYGSWGKPNTPGIDVMFYSNKADTFTITVFTDTNIPVSTTTIEGDKGFNILSYDVAFSKEGKTKYLKKNKTELTAAKDGKTYLPKGSYKMILSGNGTKEEQSFKIE